MKKNLFPKRQRIYILPTSFGGIFLGGAFVMVLIGASYQNNLVNMLAFFMLGLVFVAMVQTHNNLKHINVERLECENGFADGEMVLTTLIKNSSRTSRFNLQTNLRRRKARHAYMPDRALLPLGSLRFNAAYDVKKRGIYTASRISVESTYPLGLFRAWRAMEGEPARYFVYPKPVGPLPLPRPEQHDWEAKQAHAASGDDFRGHRLYQKGDPIGHIDWKAVARGRPLMVKELNEGAGETLRLDWDHLSHLGGDEEKLSQLSLWIQEASRRRLLFSMHLPKITITASEGSVHTKRCLQALAAYGLNDQEKPHEAS